MSHEATNWAIKVKGLKPITRIVLWHLADCHNPVMGCYPTQGYLSEHCEISRSSVNRSLDELVGKGLISREARLDKQTKRQLSTRYFLACEKGFQPQDVESRVSGSDTASFDVFGGDPCEEPVENAASRVPESGGAVSPSSGTLTSNRTSNPLPPETVDFPDLCGKWPSDKLGNLGRAAEAFERLTAHDRHDAVALADIVRSTFYLLGRPLPTLQSYLRKKAWEEVMHNPPEIERDRVEQRGWFKIVPGTQEWAKWLDHYKRTSAAIYTGMKRNETAPDHTKRRILTETRWPPNPTAAPQPNEEDA